MTKNFLLSLAAMAMCLPLFTSPILASVSPPEEGGVLPMINLPVPQSHAVRNYLGLSGEGFFTIPQIKAKVVIVEIFSMYCPHCQWEAPKVNELYWAVEKDSDLKGQIKIIGIGAGNSSYEVGIFRENYQIPFPLFPDEDFIIHEAVGQVRTPYFIGVKINADGSHTVFYSKEGGFEEPHQFLKSILTLSGL
jgi:thiol-disulfide isomerase/thioredoxin